MNISESISKATSQSEVNNLLVSRFGIYAADIYLSLDGSDDYSDLYSLINTTIAGKDAEIWFKDATCYIANNISIPSNIKLKFLNGGMLKPANGVAITGVNAKIEAGLTQIFDLSLGGTVGGTWNIKEVYPEWFGVIDYGNTDVSSHLQYAVNFANYCSRKVVLQGFTYVINSTVYLPSDINIKGLNKFKTKLQNNGSLLNSPLITNSNYNNTNTNSNIRLSRLSVITTGERTVYSLSFVNCFSSALNNCYVGEKDATSSTNASKHGAEFIRGNGYSGSMFLTNVSNCRFSRASLIMEPTDSYIDKNELWGNEREFALKLIAANNSFIEKNQIVGGNVYGGIYGNNNISGLKMLGNYFDGSYYNIDTKYGIYFDAAISHSIISNSNFWRQKSGAIYIRNLQNSDIVDNVFEENDRYENKVPDIEIADAPAGLPSFGNNICNNKFYKNLKVDAGTGVESARTTSSPANVIKLYNTSGYPSTIVTGNTLAYQQYYGVAVYNGAGYSVSNNNRNDKFINDIYSATYNPPSIATGTEAYTTITVTGAVLGDEVKATFSQDLQLINLTAYISAADTATCVFRNDTGGSIDLASGTLRVRLIKTT